MVKAFENLKTFVPNWIKNNVESFHIDLLQCVELDDSSHIDLLQCVELDDSFLVLTLDKSEDEAEFQVFFIGKYPTEYDCLPDECVWAMTHNEFFDDMSIDTTEYETLEQYANQMFINQLAGYGM